MKPVDVDPNEPLAIGRERSPRANALGESSGLGPRLRAIRRSRGLSLRELARRLDLSPSSISQIETGKMQPSVRTLYALVSEFGVTVDEVLFDQAAAGAGCDRPRRRSGAGRGGPRARGPACRRTPGHHAQLRRARGSG